MIHSFKLKKPHLKTIFLTKLDFKSVSIDDGKDVYNSVNTILNYIDLDKNLTPMECSYNYVKNQISFQLQLNPTLEKQVFFKSIKAFEAFMELE